MHTDVAETVSVTPTAITVQTVPGLRGPFKLTMEQYREYDFVDTDGRPRTYRISDPLAFYYREKGSTHRVVDSWGVVHCVPAPGFNGCVLRWKNRDVEAGADPVSY